MVSPAGPQARLSDLGMSTKIVQNNDVRRCEQPDESVFDVRTVGAVLADHHDVGVGPVAQEAGHGGLRQHQQAWCDALRQVADGKAVGKVLIDEPSAQLIHLIGQAKGQTSPAAGRGNRQRFAEVDVHDGR